MKGTSEKVSVNMNIGTLSQIDLLVDMGFYSNRSDFINQSVRQALDQKQTIIENESSRHRNHCEEWFTGIYAISKAQLLQAKETGQKIKIGGYGIIIIDKSLDRLALETIESININGKLIASPTIKEYFSK